MDMGGYGEFSTEKSGYGWIWMRPNGEEWSGSQNFAPWRALQQLRQKTWDERGPQHSHIKPHLAHWSSSKQNCRQKEVLLTRLRTGRTRLNAPWLGTQQLNLCSYCNSNTVPTVNHLLLECHHFDLHRRHITAYCRQENVPLNIEQLLGDRQPEFLTLLFQYLRETKLAGAL